jgi:serine/threonine-protein kinase
MLDPRYATARHWYAASCLAPLGHLDRALDEMLVAQALDPVSAIVARDVAVMHFYRREFDAALEQCDHTIELNPHFAPAYVTLGLIQEQREDFDESAAAFERALQLAPGTPRIVTALARNHALAGNTDAAREGLVNVTQLSKDRYVSPMELAWVTFALGDTTTGYRLLASAFADRSFDIILVHVDPRFDSMRSDPRFQRLASQLNITGVRR